MSFEDQTQRISAEIWTKPRKMWSIITLIIVLTLVGLALSGRFLGLKDTSSQARSLSAGSVLEMVPPPVPDMELEAVTPDNARAINLEQPFVTQDPSPATAFVWRGNELALARAVDCLAAAAWYEAGDDVVGQRSVIQVVLNRTRHPSFPGSVCGVVFQGSERKTGCQFTFTCDGALTRKPSLLAWQKARSLAQVAIDGYVDTSVGTATHYHTDWVVPYWRSSLDKIAQVRTHLFYRWKGYWGMPSAFKRTAFDEEPTVPKLFALSSAHAEGVADPSEDTLEIATLADAPLPSPIVLEGVREKSLRQSVVRSRLESSDTFFIQVDGGRFPGNFATAALAICKGRSPCKVLGWKDPALMAFALPLKDDAKRALSFYFSHGEASGDVALWNCADFARKNQAQCLPSNLSEIDALVAKPVM